MNGNPPQIRCIGILTSGGDCPGLNAAIRGIAKAAIQRHGMEVIGIRDGFRGLVENRVQRLDTQSLSNVLTLGGTILGTSRDKPNKMLMGDQVLDMTAVAVANARSHGIECLVCLGGNGTQKNAHHLQRAGGLDVMTLPKTIDNDVFGTDVSFGFDTAMSIAAEAIDRLHTTATSHDRIIVVEVMGNSAGWLALGAGLAAGADVILIPEIPYDLHVVKDYLLERQRRFGKRFSIIVVAEGALSREQAAAARSGRKNAAPKPEAAPDGDVDLHALRLVHESLATSLARKLQMLTGTDARVTALGHVQRGGGPTPADRLLCTRLGVKAADLLAEGVVNVMTAVRGSEIVPVPLDQVAGRKKTVPLDHPWLHAARSVGTCLGVPDRELQV
jgi:ATP-dependent phosphofructokinase / diphosphate-dependent phosphofructokinase